MPYHIIFQDNRSSDDPAFDTALITARMRTAITATLDQHEIDPHTGLTVVLESDDAVQLMNKTYRGVDTPTDVLSFPADPLPDTISAEMSKTENAYLGDLIIGVAYTLAQAARFSHAVADEFSLLAVHGTLHLLGYDHDTAENQAEMWDTQHAVLAALDNPIRVPLFDLDGDSDDAENSDHK